MLSRIWLINTVLAIFVVFLCLRAYGVWSQEEPGGESNRKPKKMAGIVEKPGSSVDERLVPAEKDYAVVIDKNLFSPERKESLPEEKKPTQEEDKLFSVEKKNLEEMLDKIVIYGLVITKDAAKALVTDVSYEPVVRRGRRLKLKKLTVGKTKWVSAGDRVGEFEVAEIKSDRISLRIKGNDYELLLYDKEKLKPHKQVIKKSGPTVVGVTVPMPKEASVKAQPTQPQQKRPVLTKNQEQKPIVSEKKSATTPTSRTARNPFDLKKSEKRERE